MALTESNMLDLGTEAPHFQLLNTVDQSQITLDDVATESGTVIMFLCNHCPYVIHVNQGIVDLANEYLERGIGFVAISSNDINRYPQDAPDKMTEVARELKYPFPYLYDESQNVAKDYDAACTPDFYLFDGDRQLVYRGQMDGSRPGSDIPVTGEDLREALDALLDSNPMPTRQRPSAGCGIKWK